MPLRCVVLIAGFFVAIAMTQARAASCQSTVAAMKVPQAERGWLDDNICGSHPSDWEPRMRQSLECIAALQPRWDRGHAGLDGMLMCTDPWFLEHPAERDRSIACGKAYRAAGVVRHDDAYTKCAGQGDILARRDGVIACLKEEQRVLARIPALADLADDLCPDAGFRAHVGEIARCALDAVANKSLQPAAAMQACRAAPPKDYTLRAHASPAAPAANARFELQLELEIGQGFALNTNYPRKFTLAAPDGVSCDVRSFARDQIKVDRRRLALVLVCSAPAGHHQVSGELKFAYGNSDLDFLARETATWSVDVN